MNERQIDLAHTVALGSIDDEDHQEVQELFDSEDPSTRGVHPGSQRHQRSALRLATATAPPPPTLRARLLAAIAAEQPPVAS
uniref:Truncated regulator of SigK n=1 Tax=Nocardia asteroides TaxID=1824 RepID=C6GH81_NOCAS|nr:truncated regulator of SigK [Nocardia asteroides]